MQTQPTVHKAVFNLLFVLIVIVTIALISIITDITNVFASPLYTDISGTITTNTTWTPAGNPYILTDNLTVAENATLTIQPGVIVKANWYTGYPSFVINGNLVALGTAGNPIVFTSNRDDNYGGDSNGDGDASLPAKGDWGGFDVYGKGTVTLDNVKILYAYEGIYAYPSSALIEGVGITVTNSLIDSALTYGVIVMDDDATRRSNVSFSNNTVSTGSGTGLQVSGIGVGSLSIQGNHFNDNQSALWIETTSATILNNLFANDSNVHGYVRVSGNLIMQGNSATGASRPLWLGGTLARSLTLESGIPVYGFESTFSVSEGYTLTIQPGVTIKSQSGYNQLVIQGVLDAQGSAAEPVVFTSYRDDQYGGDSNADGDASLPQAGDWGGLSFGGKAKAILNHTMIRYAGNGVYAYASDVTNEAVSIAVYNSQIEENAGNGLSITDNNGNLRSTVIISNSIFQHNNNYGLQITGIGVNTPLIQNNNFSENLTGLAIDVPAATIQNNTFVNSIDAHASVRVNGALTLNGNSATGNPRFFWLDGTIQSNLLLDPAMPVYGLGTSLTIAQGYTLTVGPGIVLKPQSHQLTILGNLDVQGTAANPVVFTSYQDDSYGGDTNHDGDASLPASNNWSGIVLGNKARVNLNSALIRYASTGLSASVGDVANEAVAITIRDSRFEYQGYNGISISDNNANLRSTVTISNSTFHHNGYLGLQISGLGIAPPLISGNTFSENSIGLMVDVPSISLLNNHFADNLTSNATVTVNGSLTLIGNNASGAPRPFGLGGTINSNLQLDAALPVYGFEGSLLLSQGYTLTILPGAVIKTQSNYYAQSQIQGVLDVQGTAANPVVFTSYRDDAYGGDSNGDGDASLPQANDWWGISFGGKAKAKLSYALIRFASNGIYAATSDATNEAVTIIINQSRIEESSSNGVSISDGNANLRSTVLISNSTFYNNGNTGVTISGIGIHTPTLTSNHFDGNVTGLSLDVPGAQLINNSFTNNSATHAQVTVNGTLLLSGNSATGDPRPFWIGGTIASNLTLQPTLPVYGFMNTVAIASGYTLTVLPGVVIKSQNYYYNQLLIQGTLDVQGSTANPVIFTSSQDDTYGGDSNGDGGATLPANNDWNGIVIGGNGKAKLNYCLIRYASTALSAATSDATNEAFSLLVTNSRFEENGSNGIYAVDNNANLRSNVTVTNTIFTQNTSTGMTIVGVGVNTPVIASNIFSDNITGLSLNTPSALISSNNFVNNSSAHAHVTVNGALTLLGNRASGEPRPFWLGGTINSNLSLSSTLPIYGIENQFTIPQNYTLTLQPGVILKSTGFGLTVLGALEANGIEGTPVIFTSYLDDEAGGDSDGDGGASLPSPGQWNGIRVERNGRVLLNQSQVRYANYGILGSASTSASEAVSVTLTNSLIENSSQSGLMMQDQNSSQRSSLLATKSAFRDNNIGITIYNPAMLNITLLKNQIYNNQDWGLINYTPNVNVDARNQWWGDPTGPQHESNQTGSGNPVSDGVLFDPWQAFATDAPTDSELPTLAVGAQITFSLKPLQPFYLKIQPQPDKNLLLTIDGNLASGLTINSALRVLVSHGVIPSVTDFDQEALTALPSAHLEMPIAPTIGGEYYLLVYAPFVSTGTVNGIVRASYVDMSITKVSPNVGGNAGNLTINIEGTGLSDAISATLISPAGVRLAAIDQLISSDTLLFATFNLSGTLPGNYTLELKRTTDGSTISKANAVTVQTGLGARLKVHMDGPENVRPGRVYNYKLYYENVGDADMPAPYLSVSTSGPGAILFAEGYTSAAQLTWLAASEGSRGDLLPVGGKGTIQFHIYADNSVPLIIGTVEEGNDPFEWNEMAVQLAKSNFPSSTWESVIEIFGTSKKNVLDNLRTLNIERSTPIALDSLVELALWSTLSSNASIQTASQTSTLTGVSFYGQAEAEADVKLLVFDRQSASIFELRARQSITYFNPSWPIIVITHGWRDSGYHQDYIQMATQLANHYPKYNILIVSWETGAASPPDCGVVLPTSVPFATVKIIHEKAPECATIVSTRAKLVGQIAFKRLNEQFYTEWANTLYIGHSFGNVVNAYIAESAIHEGKGKGKALLLNPATPLVFFPPWYSRMYSASTAITTYDVADSKFLLPVDRVVRYWQTDCNGNTCTPLGDAHGSAKRLLTCWLAASNSSLDCGAISKGKSSLAKAFIENDWGYLRLNQGFYHWVDKFGNLTHLAIECKFAFLAPYFSCRPSLTKVVYTYDSYQTYPVTVVRPTDPNDKIGPTGVGAQHIIAANSTLDYVINFENVGTATAPVQELLITDLLDPNLDLSTLQLTSISYGGRTILIDSNSALEYTALDEPPASVITGTVQEKILIDISAKLNTQNGMITWLLRSVDSATGALPEDALAGFLPPEDGTGRGQGYVTFSIKPKATTAHGTVIKNKADITFDTNAAIGTNEVSNLVGDAVDLALQLDSTDQVAMGASRTLKFTVFNDGPAIASNVSFTYTAPLNTTVTSIAASQGSCTTSICNLGTLAENSHVTVMVNVVAGQMGVVTETASVSSNAIELNAFDNQLISNVTVLSGTIPTPVPPTATPVPPTATPVPPTATQTPLAAVLTGIGEMTGAPGSGFVFVGSGYPPNRQIPIYLSQAVAEADASALTPIGTVTTDSQGNLAITLLTTGSTLPGEFTVSVGDAPRLSVTFTVAIGSGLQQPTAQGITLTMPSVFNQQRVFLPLVSR